MPEPSKQQCNFTSSTYRAITTEKTLNFIEKHSFLDNLDIRAFLEASKEGIVPEALLYRLLTTTGIYLKEKFKKNLGGLCLGYALEQIVHATLDNTIKTSSPDKEIETFYVNWGWDDEYVEMLQPSKVSNVNLEVLDFKSSEAQEDLNILETNLEDLDPLQQEIDEEFLQIEASIELFLQKKFQDSLKENQKICVFLFGHFNSRRINAGSGPCGNCHPPGSTGRGEERYENNQRRCDPC